MEPHTTPIPDDLDSFLKMSAAYGPDGTRQFLSVREIEHYFERTLAVARSNPTYAGWIAETAAGVAALADVLLEQDDTLDAVHALLLDICAQGSNSWEDEPELWEEVGRLLQQLKKQDK